MHRHTPDPGAVISGIHLCSPEKPLLVQINEPRYRQTRGWLPHNPAASPSLEVLFFRRHVC
jgi:hypothetical protein